MKKLDLVSGWSCDERDRTVCRNPHGCHCREITALLSRTEPQGVPHPDETVNFNGRLVTWAEIDAAVRKRNAALSRPELCSHEAIISLDGKWHCQKCGDAIEMATAYAHPSQLLGTENGR